MGTPREGNQASKPDELLVGGIESTVYIVLNDSTTDVLSSIKMCSGLILECRIL